MPWVIVDTKQQHLKNSQQYRDRKERASEEVIEYVKKEKKEKKGKIKDNGLKKGEDVESCTKTSAVMMEDTQQPAR